MADKTKIEWTDATWNPITGCSVLSAGCKRCYAMKLAGTRMKHHHSREGLTIETKAGPVWNGIVRFNDSWINQPLQWAKPRMIFLNAHGDTWHEGVKESWIDQIMARVALAPQHIVQALTKRSRAQADYLDNPDTPSRVQAEMDQIRPGVKLDAWPLPNLWVGVSVEDQENAYRLDDLAGIEAAAVRWVSAEPLLGPLDVSPWLDRLHWVVAGGESDKGPNARPAHPDWFRALRDQCAAARVAFLFKQWGDWTPVDMLHPRGRERHHFSSLCEVSRVGKKAAGRQLDGRTHDGFPHVLAA